MPVSQEHIDYVVSLYSCFNDNTLGKKNALRKLNEYQENGSELPLLLDNFLIFSII